MGRHALVDLATVFGTRAPEREADRLPAEQWARLCGAVGTGSAALHVNRLTESQLRKLRTTYEPFASALGSQFLIALPAWMPVEPTDDNWRRTSWERPRAPFAVSDPFSDQTTTR
jgi:hypothetical protein